MLLTNEDLLTLPAAAKTVKRNGRSVATSTVYRWATRGIDGIRLETIQAGGVLCTSKPAVDRFFTRLTAQKNGGPDPLPEHQTRQADVQARLNRHFSRRSA